MPSKRPKASLKRALIASCSGPVSLVPKLSRRDWKTCPVKSTLSSSCPAPGSSGILEKTASTVSPARYRDQEAVARQPRDPHRAHRDDLVDIGLQPRVQVGNVGIDDHVADIGFVDDDADSAAREVAGRDNSNRIVVVLSVDALDPVEHRLQVGKRNLPAEQAAPQRREQGRRQRHRAFEIDLAEPDADLGKFGDRHTGDRRGDGDADARRAPERRLVAFDHRRLVDDDLTRPRRRGRADRAEPRDDRKRRDQPEPGAAASRPAPGTTSLRNHRPRPEVPPSLPQSWGQCNRR